MGQTSDLPVFVDVQGSEQYPGTESLPLLDSTQTPVTENNAEKVEEEQDRKAFSMNDAENGGVQRATDRIRCPECLRYTADNEEKMMRHIRKVHRGENPFQCYMCDYSTYNKAVFEEHVRIHQGIKPFKCTYCPYRSASKKNTKKHEQRHRPDNPLKCAQCPFIARHHRSLVCHREKLNHGNKCTECSYIGKDEKDLEDHASLHNGDSLFICNQCDTRYPNQKALQTHKRHRAKCKECKAQLCTKYRLKRHMLLEHDMNLQESKEPTFVCSICKWAGNSKARILLHLIHHPKQTVDESIVDVSILRKLGIMQ